MSKIETLRNKLHMLQKFRGLFRGKAEYDALSLRRCWSVWTESGRERETRGFRMIPGAGFRAWPYGKGREDTIGQGGQGRYLVPIFLVTNVLLMCDTEYWLCKSRKDWVAIKSEFQGLHELLGGEESQFDQIEELLFTGLSLPVSSKERRALQYELCCKVWPTEKHVFVRNLLETQFDSDQSLEVPENLGIWENIALTSSFVRSTALLDGSTEFTAGIAWRLLHQAPQHDTGGAPDCQSHFPRGTGVFNPSNLLRAFVALTKHGTEEELDEWSKAPLFQTVMQDMAKDREGPWHLAYMEAAAGYDGLDQPEIAWNMLCSGNFWVNRRGGNWRPFFDAALALAGRRGWVDIVEAMEDMAERAQLD